MPRYKLTIAYDGTDFHGWQKQEPPDPDAPPPEEGEEAERLKLRTVQHVVEQAVREVIREPIILTGASRTDAGVHAGGRFPDGTLGGQVAAFTSFPEEEKGSGWPLVRGLDPLQRALNGRLPPDVKVQAVEVAQPEFDPIADAVSKSYSYTIHAGNERPLWDRQTVCHTWYELDPGQMASAGYRLIGEHDFASFAAAGHGRQTTVREIHDCTVQDLGEAEGGKRIRITVSGSGFLYNMVRIIAGTLVEVGRGKIKEEQIPEIIASCDRANAGPTLPPEGLRLEWIRYDTSS